MSGEELEGWAGGSGGGAVGTAHPSLPPQDLWQCCLRQEYQGRRLRPDREELCPGQVEGGWGCPMPQFPLLAKLNIYHKVVSLGGSASPCDPASPQQASLLGDPTPREQKNPHEPPPFPPQKAVRVTTLMKRLRAPEQTEAAPAPASTAANTTATAAAATTASTTTAATDTAAPATPAATEQPPASATPPAATCNGDGAAAAATTEAPSEQTG